jgi:hypothetical protein
VGAQFGTVAAKVLIEQDGLNGGTRWTSTLRLGVGANQKERRAGLLVCHGNQQGGPSRLVGALTGGWVCLVSHGVVGVVAAVATDVCKQGLDGGGVHGLVDEWLKELLYSAHGGQVGSLHADAKHSARSTREA